MVQQIDGLRRNSILSDKALEKKYPCWPIVPAHAQEQLHSLGLTVAGRN